ncbi:CAZyme family GH43 [Paecilomyces variotii]|nr:CAZyme family GH43 [Paecilomyces variotii]KAJ9231979.1 CAZyme family GH43 [Paecilomyces variotii]
MIASRPSYIALPQTPAEEKDGCPTRVLLLSRWNVRRAVKMLVVLFLLSLTSLCYSLTVPLKARDADTTAGPGGYAHTHPTDLMIHDPSVIKYGDKYYAYGVGVYINIWESWTMDGPWNLTGSLLDGPAAINKGANTEPWAPNTIQVGDTFYCYYAVSEAGSRDSAIGVATSSHPGPGGWTDHGLVLQTGSGVGSQQYPMNVSNAIDPTILIADVPYLIYGSYWTGIYQVPLSEDMLSMAEPQSPDATHLVYAPQGIHPAEGSFATYHAPYYYLWFSHGQCCDLNANALPAAGHEYSIRVGRSMDPRGPYLDKDGTDLVNGGGTIVYASNDDVYAPGGEGVLNDGQNDILFYHYVNTTVGYGFNQTSMGWNFLDYPDGWPVATYNRPSTSSSSYFW